MKCSLLDDIKTYITVLELIPFHYKWDRKKKKNKKNKGYLLYLSVKASLVRAQGINKISKHDGKLNDLNLHPKAIR